MDKRGAILMSEKERDALVVLERVRRREVTMAAAARQLGICYRQNPKLQEAKVMIEAGTTLQQRYKIDNR